MQLIFYILQRMEQYDFYPREPLPVMCSSHCQSVSWCYCTPDWLSWGQARLTSALLALWPELRLGWPLARRDIPPETLLHYTLHYTLHSADQQRYCTHWGQCLALEWLWLCSWQQIQHPHRYPPRHLHPIIALICDFEPEWFRWIPPSL